MTSIIQSNGFYNKNHLLKKLLGKVTTTRDRGAALNLKMGKKVWAKSCAQWRKEYTKTYQIEHRGKSKHIINQYKYI